MSCTASGDWTTGVYAQMANARNWPQDVEGWLWYNVYFQLGAWFNSVKSVKLNSTSMLGAQAGREHSRQINRTKVTNLSCLNPLLRSTLPHRLDMLQNAVLMLDAERHCSVSSSKWWVSNASKLSWAQDLILWWTQSRLQKLLLQLTNFFLVHLGEVTDALSDFYFFSFISQRLLMINLKAQKPAGHAVKGSFNLTD